jgi:hypothetical protein
VLQDGPGVVNPAAFVLFRKAIGSADRTVPGTADFEALPAAGGRQLNGPQASFAYTLQGTDTQQFGNFNAHGALIVPPAPALASEDYAAELIELYWASLLRDVPFTAYDTNLTAQAAAAELSRLPAYRGPRDSSGQVTTDLLFRGGGTFKDRLGVAADWFAGETVGPYMSQLALQPTVLGGQRIDQLINTCTPGMDFMTDLATWALVQNGAPTGQSFALTGIYKHLHDGRGIAAFSHQDELYQAYFTAYLAMKTLGVPTNPGNPYIAYKRQQAFGTFGGPDIAATLAAVAKVALDAVWYQKWNVHLRHRPESGGGLVELQATGMGGTVEGHVSDTVLNSMALARSASFFGSHLLSQAFPEGSPAHPAYPTGHGTVAGACITVLKFFFDATTKITAPLVTTDDGLSVVPYAGPGMADMTIAGELHKLAHNISFGHGIHAGIHWRSDTDYSIRMGEEVAINFLRDQATTYRETFSVDLVRVDGSTVTIAN